MKYLELLKLASCSFTFQRELDMRCRSIRIITYVTPLCVFVVCVCVCVHGVRVCAGWIHVGNVGCYIIVT